MKHATILAGLLIAVLMFTQLPAFGQVGSGRLSATVYDASGAVIPNAKVVLKNEASNSIRETVTNASGVFEFPAIPPGTYTVTVTAPGFTSWEGNGIAISQGASATLPNVTLNVRGAKQEVTVVSASEMIVPVDTGQASTTLNSQMISQLTLSGRDAAELIKIMPGMGFNNGLHQGSSFDPTMGTSNNSGPIGMYSANGTQPFGGMTMTSDGANLLDPGNQGTQVANINADQTAEVTLLTSAYGAEFAKGPVTFQAIGKSGGAQFHGSAYLYARNGVFNSNNSFNNALGVERPDDHYYYPGGDIGGPVLIPGTNFNKNRDKLFFYAAFEDMRQQQAGALHSYFMATPDMMGQASGKAFGDFTPAYLASLGPAWNAKYGTGGTFNVAPCATANRTGECDATTYPGGKIPLSAIDPNSLIYWKTEPINSLVSTTSNSIGANYLTLINPPQNRWEIRLRGDYNISDNTKVFFSWNRQDESDQNPINIWWQMGAALPYPSGMPANQSSNVYSANLTHVFSPTLTNEFVFAEAKFVNPINLANPAAVDPSALGFHMASLFSGSYPYVPQLPDILGSWDNSNSSPGVPGYSAYTMGIKGYIAQFGKTSQAPNISDNISKVWGTHTVKAGFYWDYNRNWQTGGNINPSAQGTLSFFNYQPNTTGNTMADFVTGRALLNQANGFPTSDFKYYQYSFYAQDSWKATRRLTLTYGLRFDHMGNWVPSAGPGLAIWDWSTYQQPTQYTQSNGTVCTISDQIYRRNGCAQNVPAGVGINWHELDSSVPRSGFPSKSFFPEPRIGVAYDLFGNGKTVLRGGFGLYRYQLAYNSVSGAAYTAALGYVGQSTWGQYIGYNSWTPGSTQWAADVPSVGTPPAVGNNYGGFLTQGDSRTPHTYTFNFTVSQRVPWNSVAEFQYSGNRSRDMMLSGNNNFVNINRIPDQAFFRPDPLTGANPCATLTPGCAANVDIEDYYPLWTYTPSSNGANNMNVITHGSYSNYNAFIATWQKQTGRVTFTANYTFSKALGIRDGETDNGNGQGATVDPYVLANNYGVLAFDHTHIFNAAYVINLPSPVHGSKILGGIVNGWELSGITQFQSGAPIQPNTGGAMNANWPSTYSPQQWLGSNMWNNTGTEPLVTCDPRKGLSSGQYFNPNCFAPPSTMGQNGTIIWPYIKGPGYIDSDLSIYKNFNFKEHQQIQFRFQTYNFLNHPNADLALNSADITLSFNNNNTITQQNINTQTNGKALNTGGRRVLMFSLKYMF
jgi:hypothetical protein